MGGGEHLYLAIMVGDLEVGEGGGHPWPEIEQRNSVFAPTEHRNAHLWDSHLFDECEVARKYAYLSLYFEEHTQSEPLDSGLLPDLMPTQRHLHMCFSLFTCVVSIMLVSK